MTTRAPACARPRAIASPRPEPPPVTSARRPERSNGCRLAIAVAYRNPSTSLHVVEAGLPRGALRGDEHGGAQRAAREVLPRRRAVRQLDALARAREDHRVLADDVAAAQRREADGARPCARRCGLRARTPRSRRACGPCPRRPLRPAAAPCPTARRPCACGASRRSRCRSPGPSCAAAARPATAARRRPRSCSRAKTIGTAARSCASVGLLRVVKPGGADDGADAVPRAGGDVRERALGPREVDQDVGAAQRRVDVVADDDAGGAAEALAGVAAERRRCPRRRAPRRA